MSGEGAGKVSWLESRLDRLTDENKGLRMRVEQLAETVQDKGGKKK